MRPIRQTVGALAVSSPIVLDTYRDPFNVGIGVALSAGASLTYKVQHTFDDVTLETFNPSTATWYDNATLVAKTTSSDGNYAYPVTAIRLNVTVYASGNAVMTVIQAGVPGS
jgi:hypothetical protein